MTDIEQAARAEAERRYPDRKSGCRDKSRRPAFVEGASWLADYLLSDENVEKAARAAAILGDYDGCFERLEAWRNATPEQRMCLEVDEPLSFDEEDAEFWRVRARAALQAVLGKEQ